MHSKGEKRVAPISSSAFSFSLGSPAKKVKPERRAAVATAAAVSVLPGPPGLASPRAPRHTTTTPVRPVSSLITTPVRPERVTARGKVTPGDKATPRDKAPPGLPSFSVKQDTTPRATRRINDVLDASPFRVGNTPLTHSIAPPVVSIKEREHVVHLEGIGVSPRKFRGNIQYKGPGIPPSVRLATLLSSNTTAIVLFYTSLQHALRKATGDGVAKHVGTAPLRLRVVDVVGGRTHAATMLRCTVAEPKTDENQTRLVVFQSLPTDCPLVGTDPRLVASGKEYEVGIWAPWTERQASDGSEMVVFASRYLIAAV